MEFPIILHGIVEHGRKLGSKMNIPTANIVPKEDVSGLAFGVYYSVVVIDGREYRSITNLGTKPTVNELDKINVETFIYDFEGDIYDEAIIVKLLEYKRPEMRFESIELLFKQINEDLDAGRAYGLTKN